MSQRPSDGTDDRSQLGSLLTVVGWIVAGALALAGLMALLESVLSLPLSRPVAVGLGLALGGGTGGVARLYRSESGEGTGDETMTVSVEPQETSPEPADLFDGHPDPVLYYATEGHGPIVRAANPSYGETFDVPPDRLAGTPLSEALLVAGDTAVEADEVTSGSLDRVVACDTATGSREFRLRTIGDGESGYLLYTPEAASSVRG